MTLNNFPFTGHHLVVAAFAQQLFGIMTEESDLDATPFDTMGAPPSVFPKSSWAHSMPSDETSDMCGQFGAQAFSSKVSDNTGQLQHFHMEFLHINQE